MRAIATLLVCLVMPLVGLGALTGLAPRDTAARMLAGECFRIYERDGVVLSREQVDPALCAAFDPTPTAVPPTATAPPTPIPAGWHAPTTHEHGDAPPAWVLASGNPPFTQTRESHTGYKGAYARSPGGAESYLITHILSTVTARSHGDHDYQLWLRNPNTGEVLYRAGALDFGNPPPLRTVDTGERPIILGERSATDGCETWYSRPGALLMDMGWTICGRYQRFDGTVIGGTGTFRTVDWIVYPDRLPPGSSLRDTCRVEFGVCRISFIRNSVDYQTGTVVPIN